MSTYKIVLFFCCFQFSLLAQEQNNVSVAFHSPSFQHKMYYLAGYYGKYTVLLDSVNASNEGSIIFKNNKKYTEGIYLLVDANKSIVTEFIMDEKQQFSIDVNVENTSKNTVRNSKTNQDFLEFNIFLKSRFSKLDVLNNSLGVQKTATDSLLVKNKIAAIQKEISNYKFDYIENNQKSVVSLLFRLSQSPDSYFDTIDNSTLLKNKTDSLNYLKNNFFKGIDFSDARLLRNPFLEKKIATYFGSFVKPTSEEITQEVFKILDSTGSKENELFSYLSLYFINTYSAPKIMGLDRVFINIYNQYFKNKEYSWLTAQQKLAIRDTNIDLKDNLIGNSAPNLFMKTRLDKRIDLHDVDASFIVLVFWDPNCGHCKTELPKINKTYHELWKEKGVKIFAVNINADLLEQWNTYIEKEQLKDWIHVVPSSVVTGNYTKEDVDFQTLYNVHQTPVLYLLDANKKMIAKKVSFEKYIDIIKKVEIKLN